MDSSPEPKPKPAPQAAPQARPTAAPSSLGPNLADSYTALPGGPPAKRSYAAIWAGLCALAAAGWLVAHLVR